MVSVTLLWPGLEPEDITLMCYWDLMFSLISNCRKLILNMKETCSLEEGTTKSIAASANTGAQYWMCCWHPVNCAECMVMLLSFSIEGLWCLGKIWILIIKWHLTNTCGVPDTVLGIQCEWYPWDTPNDTASSKRHKVPAYKLLEFTSWQWDKEAGCVGGTQHGQSTKKNKQDASVQEIERDKTNQSRWPLLCSSGDMSRKSSSNDFKQQMTKWQNGPCQNF